MATYMRHRAGVRPTPCGRLSGDGRRGLRYQQQRRVLTFVRAPDYENAADADMNNEYMVTVMADDGTYMAMRDVTVMVTDVDDDTTPVVTDGTLLDRYDTDVDGVSGEIDRSEVIMAINDYFFVWGMTPQGST